MSEQTTLTPETTAPEATTPAAPKVTLFILIALASLVGALFFNCTATLIRSIEYAYDGMLTATFVESVLWMMCGAILPVSLFLLKDNANRKKLSKIFMIVALAFVAIQLLSACFSFILVIAIKFFDAESSNFTTIIYSISGSDLFAPISQLIYGSDIYYFFAACFNFLAALLYIVPNAICVLGFLKLSK